VRHERASSAPLATTFAPQAAGQTVLVAAARTAITFDRRLQMLTIADRDRIAAVIEAALGEFTSIASLESFVRGPVRVAFPHSMLAAIVGSIDGRIIRVDRLVTVDYRMEFFASFKPVFDVTERPVVWEWLRTRRPVFIDVDRPAPYVSAAEFAEAARFELGSLAIDGIVDLGGTRGTYFSFAGVPAPSDPRTALLLRAITPHLHSALVKLHWALSD
jgi:hypothetical protein